MAENMEKRNHWLEVFANFREGALLIEAIKAKEPFVRSPQWISPLYSDGYRCYRTFEIEGLCPPLSFPLPGKAPLWDGVCFDKTSGKYLFVRIADSPAELRGCCENISVREKAAMEKAFGMLNLNGDPESWYREYYPFARDLTHVTLLSDPAGGYLPQGCRGELVILNQIRNYCGAMTGKETWDDFYTEMSERMFGPRGLPYVVFLVDFVL